MLRARTVITMRQQQHEPALISPFGFAARDELIDDHLGIVHKVTELRFPDHQIPPALQRIAVFEPEYRFFGQWRLENGESSLRLRDVPKRNVEL